MPDDAYEFLGPDVLSAPPPGPPPGPPGPIPPPPPPGPTADAPKPVSGSGPAPDGDAQNSGPQNELVTTSAAQKFQVPPTAPKKSKKGSNSDESKKEVKKGKKSEESANEPIPSLGTFKCQMIFSGIMVFASIGLTIMVLVEGLL